MSANRNDPRRFYTTQAVHRSYLGLSPETGPSGYAARLSATPVYTIEVDIVGGITGAQILGDLPPGVILTGRSWLVGVFSAGSAAMSMPAFGDLPAVTLGAVALNSQGAKALTAQATPTAVSRPIAATITASVAGQSGKLLIEAVVMNNPWF